MRYKNLGSTFIVLLFGMFIAGCSQGSDDSAIAADDTVVHDAEVSAAGMDDVMAKGEQIYLANCAACHQANGQGLTGAFPPLAQSDFLEGDRKQATNTFSMFSLSSSSKR